MKARSRRNTHTKKNTGQIARTTRKSQSHNKRAETDAIVQMVQSETKGNNSSTFASWFTHKGDNNQIYTGREHIEKGTTAQLEFVRNWLPQGANACTEPHAGGLGTGRGCGRMAGGGGLGTTIGGTAYIKESWSACVCCYAPR